MTGPTDQAPIMCLATWCARHARIRLLSHSYRILLKILRISRIWAGKGMLGQKGMLGHVPTCDTQVSQLLHFSEVFNKRGWFGVNRYSCTRCSANVAWPSTSGSLPHTLGHMVQERFRQVFRLKRACHHLKRACHHLKRACHHVKRACHPVTIRPVTIKCGESP